MWHIKQAFVGWLKSLFGLDAIETEHIVFTDPGNYAHKMCSAVTFMRLNSVLLRCCLGAFREQTWKQSRDAHVESHLLCWAVSWGSTSSAAQRWESKVLFLCCPREAAWALSGSLAGGFWAQWVVLVTHAGESAGEGLRLWLPEQGTLMCKAPAKIAAPCLGWCFRHSAWDFGSRQQVLPKAARLAGLSPAASKASLELAVCLVGWMVVDLTNRDSSWAGERGGKRWICSIIQSRPFLYGGNFPHKFSLSFLPSSLACGGVWLRVPVT